MTSPDQAPKLGTREHFLQVSELQRWGTIQEYVDLCLPLQSCKLFFSGSASPGYGSTRNTILTSSRATSTRLTRARMRSRLLAQSAASKPYGLWPQSLPDGQ